jgi:RNA polymerase sigma factor (sigma-70 family)
LLQLQFGIPRRQFSIAPGIYDYAQIFRGQDLQSRRRVNATQRASRPVTLDGTTVMIQPLEQPDQASATIDLNQELQTGFTARYVRHKVRLLLWHARLRTADRPDLEQELKLAVWKAFPKFDPSRGDWRAFVATVVERRAGKLVRDRRFPKRQEANEVDSLDILVEDPDGLLVSLGSQIREDQKLAQRASSGPDDFERIDMEHDVAAIIASLPPEHRAICEQLKQGSQSQAARKLKMARSTLRCRLAEIRQRFVAGGYGEEFDEILAS